MIKITTKKGLTLLLSLFISLVSLAQDISTDAGVITQGQGLFSDNCTQCHLIGTKLVGPDLKDVLARRNPEWIKAFITNSTVVINSGDKYAVKLYNEYNKTEMPAHSFSDDELNSIVAYLNDATINYVAPVADVVVVDDTNTSATKESGTNPIMMGMMILVLIVLIVVLFMMNNTLKAQLSKEDLNEEENAVVNQKHRVAYLWEAKWIRALVIVILLCYGADKGIDWVYGIGIQQGYKPTQPINFSHKIHAGDNEIDCNYCHTGVRKAKNANIPSANICMNCHSTVKKESPEIQKIYKAIETNTPIEWVRIHNLPDFAYFNHSQHVKVGGVECQTCHGPIEEMDVVEQHADLTMGWCINCHRETELNTEGNAYYDDLLKAHKEAKGSKAPFNVADNGGMECSRCHY